MATITMILNYLIIAALIVFIIDLSGIIDSLEWWLSKTLNIKAKIPKPFSCSLCMTWWTLLLIALCTGPTLTKIGLAALLAYLTPQIKDTLILLSTGIQSLLNLLQNLIDR